MHRNSGWAGHAYMIVAGALVGFALILQFYLTANLVVAQGGHLVTAMLVFLDFFTILTNILVLAALAAPWIAPESRLAVFFRLSARRDRKLHRHRGYRLHPAVAGFSGIRRAATLGRCPTSRHQSRPVRNLLAVPCPEGMATLAPPRFVARVPIVRCGLRDASVHGDQSLPLPIHRCCGSRTGARVRQRDHAFVRILDRRPCVRCH